MWEYADLRFEDHIFFAFCRFAICGLGYQGHCGFVMCELIITNLMIFDLRTHLRNFRICDCGRSPGICGFASCGLTKKYCMPTIAAVLADERKGWAEPMTITAKKGWASSEFNSSMPPYREYLYHGYMAMQSAVRIAITSNKVSILCFPIFLICGFYSIGNSQKGHCRNKG